MKVWYLHHSSFGLEIDDKFLIFDYFYDTSVDDNKELTSGVINPDQIKDYEVYVFASHRHHDHFNEIIFDWMDTLENVTYILSDDIPVMTRNAIQLEAHKVYEIDDIKIKTLRSNDEGLAFIIYVNKRCIFFSGDLNWWHWEDEPNEWNKEKEHEFKTEYETLKNHKIDIAFIPVDPRLEDSYSKSLKYFLSQGHKSVIFPMHFGDDYRIFDWLKRDKLDQHVMKIHKRGQEYIIGD
jgi:L-ascorbate metabolism protein UlaG (beta-lactamase superfamily)